VNTDDEVGAVMEKLRKACVLDWKCRIRSYVLVRISTHVPNQNLLIKLKNLGYLNFSTTIPNEHSSGKI